MCDWRWRRGRRRRWEQRRDVHRRDVLAFHTTCCAGDHDAHAAQQRARGDDLVATLTPTRARRGMVGVLDVLDALLSGHSVRRKCVAHHTYIVRRRVEKF